MFLPFAVALPLNVREGQALRPVKSVVWLAVLRLIPSGHSVGIGVFRLSNLLVPVPREVLQLFSQALLPPDIPTWQLILPSSTTTRIDGGIRLEQERLCQRPMYPPTARLQIAPVMLLR